jgi:hypothetical protein
MTVGVAIVRAQDVTIRVDARQPGRAVSRFLTGSCIEDVNHEIYGGIYSQMIFGESFQEPPREALNKGLSGMWRAVAIGSATLSAGLETQNPFTGTQSQRITFTGGPGEAGIENRGLNRQGLSFVAGKTYEGYVWLRAEKTTNLNVSLESSDGSRRYAKAVLPVEDGDVWKRYPFSLAPDGAVASGRLAITLASPGSVVLGHVFLQPGTWGRFNELPLRRDVVEGLIAQGVTVMRYGGSMVNAEGYRWKKMIGPRDRRPPYRGHWYPYSTNGWGIIDFLNLCEAAGFLAIPDLNVNESPQDLADFVEYVNGPPDSEWGRHRSADGHPNPYHLRQVELGNEERINDAYVAKFAAIAQAIWATDPQIILAVGDFQYERKISDPMNLTGAASRITSLAAHRRILELAGKNHREVWFDVHVGTEGPRTATSVEALSSYIDAVDKLAGTTPHRVVVFELNANNHEQRRALANAVAIGRATRDGRIPVVTSANALQVDRQNDNGWNQGLLFLNPTSAWLQPPGYVTQMISQSYEPRVLDAEVSKPNPQLDVTAVAGEDGRAIVLRVVNSGPSPIPCEIRLDNFSPSKAEAGVLQLSAAPDTFNAADAPDRVKPRNSQWKHELKSGTARYTFPPTSFTVIRIE